MTPIQAHQIPLQDSLRPQDIRRQKRGSIPVGISACLLGQNVRYNGGHSRSRLCLDQLEPFFEFRAFCPEVAAGFGTPRPAMRLIGDPLQPQLVVSNGGDQDLSAQLLEACQPKLKQVAELDGYILMKNSPSCGLERVKVYQENGYPHEQRSQGLFAVLLKQHYPLLPVEEEGRLHDSRLQENFILRVFAHHRFRREVVSQCSLHALMSFHRDYKYVLMAHNQQEYRALGRLLAEGKGRELGSLSEEYFQRFMQALAKPASRRNHCNVLLHLMGYLKKALSGPVRQDIVRIIDQYRRGEVSLAVPLTLLQHYVRQHGGRYLQAQRYLQPYPALLGLSNRL